MKVKEMNLAHKEVKLLVEFLLKRDWDDSQELLTILENANSEIEKIVHKSIESTIAKIQNSYAEEARLWHEDKMTNSSGEKVKTTKAERCKATTELKRINKTVVKLYDILPL